MRAPDGMSGMRGAVLVVALLAGTGAADAQRAPGASYPVPGRVAVPAPPQVRPMPAAPRVGQRWPMRQGRWTAGWDAPGGWNAYRRPYAGWALPPYWVQPGFAVGDWADYGLARPPVGQRWARYYDDAVLIDGRGSVYDTVGGIDWDGGIVDGGYRDGEYGGDRYAAAPPPPAPRDDRRRDDGLGGAAIGAVAGGVAGNVIAGRGNRLGGTLIGAGVGAAAGYAIDRAEDRGRDRAGGHRPPPAHRDDRREPGHAGGMHGPGAGYPPPPYDHIPGERWTSADGTTTVVTTNGVYGGEGYGGYHGGGYPGGTTTTVVVQSAPVVTTTTTEYFEDAVTYAPARKVHRKRTWRPRANCRCK